MKFHTRRQKKNGSRCKVQGARPKNNQQATGNRQRLTINGHGWHGQTSLLAFGEFVRESAQPATRDKQQATGD
jgi:hypothetical protein